MSWCLSVRRLKIGFSYTGTPIRVSLAGKSFDCDLCRGGDWYADAFARDVDPSIFRLPTHGDYEATCRVIWSEALPEVLAEGLARSPELLERFRRMSLPTIREKVNWILRARKDSVRLERCLSVLAGLAD